MSDSKAKREHTDGVPWPMFSVASKCLVNLNHAPQVKVPGKVNAPTFFFYRKTVVCFSICVVPRK